MLAKNVFVLSYTIVIVQLRRHLLSYIKIGVINLVFGRIRISYVLNFNVIINLLLNHLFQSNFISALNGPLCTVMIVCKKERKKDKLDKK